MKRCMVIYIFLLSFPMLYSQTYYVSSSATGGGNGSFSNEWTIYEAASNANAGDIVFIKMGEYSIGDQLNFNNDGTVTDPIVFVGEYIPGYNPKTVDEDSSAFLYSTFTNQGAITITGDYYEFHNIIVEDDVGKQVVEVYGNNNTIDSCVIRYPRNNATTHTMIIKPSAQNFTLRNSYVWNSGRTIIWVESNSTEAANNALFEYNTFTGASNHYDIQIMPLTGASNPPNNTGLVIRNNVFIDNPYEAAIYLRQVSDFKIYNNLFVNSGAPVHYVSHEVGQDSVNTNGSLIVYNTIYDVTHSKYWFRNAAANQIVVKNNLFIFDDGFGSSDITMDYRCFSSQPSNRRMQIDHNSYYFIGKNILNDGTAYWSGGTCSNSSYQGMAAWKNATGFEINGIFNVLTTFEDLAGLNFTPVAGSVVNDTGTPINGITTDFYGNSRDVNNPTIGAVEYTSRGPDITPPEVTGATLLDSVTLKIMFSEVLDETTAEDENNYSISNNIDIFNAALSGSEVTLQTSVHSPGTYTVTVINVQDPSGNTILPTANTAEYEKGQGSTTIFDKIEIIEVTASDVPQPDHTPDKTIDGKGFYSGDPDSRWAGEPMPEWIMFDLGDAYSVSMTKFSFYRWNDARIYNYSILGSTDASNWQEILINANSSSGEWTIDEFEPIEVRYIRIQYHSSNQNEWAGLWEAEIWGDNPTNEITSETFPEEFELAQNYPNPFNPSTKIVIRLPKSTEMRLSVYNLLGELVSELANGEYSTGVHEFEFDASGLASGMYIYRVESPNFVEAKKMLLLR